MDGKRTIGLKCPDYQKIEAAEKDQSIGCG